MSASANFAVHLAILMRAQGMSFKELAEKSGAGRPTTGTALHGSRSNRRVSLDVAERLAIAAGGDLAAMLGPFTCGTCKGEPPAGFTCDTCGRRSATS